MKKNIFLIALFLMVFASFSQTEIKEKTLTKDQETAISSMFINYYDALQKTPKDWQKIVAYTYDPFFDFADKNMVIDQLKKSFKNPAYYTTMDKIELKEIQKSFSSKNIIYSKVNYDLIMTFHFTKTKDQSEKKLSEYVEFMLSIYKNQFLDYEVTKTENDIHLSGNKEIIAIYDEKYGNSWKMIEYLKNSESYYSFFLSKEVSKYINNHF